MKHTLPVQNFSLVGFPQNVNIYLWIFSTTMPFLDKKSPFAPKLCWLWLGWVAFSQKIFLRRRIWITMQMTDGDIPVNMWVGNFGISFLFTHSSSSSSPLLVWYIGLEFILILINVLNLLMCSWVNIWNQKQVWLIHNSFPSSSSSFHSLKCCRVNMWGSKFGKELWESLTVATRRDTIQQVEMPIIMMRKMIMLIMRLSCIYNTVATRRDTIQQVKMQIIVMQGCWSWGLRHSCGWLNTQ